MKKSTIKLLVIEITLILGSLLNIFLMNISNNYLFSGILIIASIITIILIGYEPNRKRYKKDNMMNIVIYVSLFQILLYLSGILLGFLKSSYDFSPINIIKNILPIIVFTCISEFLRYCINTKGQNNKIIIIFSIILFVLIDVSLQLYVFDFTIKSSFVELVCTVLLPSISKNILLTYLSIQFGYEGNIVYLLLMLLPTYLIPIVPNLDIYLTSILMLVFPLILLYLTNKVYERKMNDIDSSQSSYMGRISTVILLMLCFLVVALTSGVFPIFALSIGSESMLPTIAKGDVVLVKKLNNESIKDIKKGDTMIYKYNNKVIVHRVSEIMQEGENYFFKTKGDNNDRLDDWIVTQENIIGVAICNIKYIGYPTIWLNEALG